MLVDLHVAGTVHRLDGELALVLGDRGEHVLAVPLPVARGLPQRLVEDQRRVHLAVAGRILAPPHISDQVLKQLPAFRVPEDDARPLLLEMEEVHLAPELAVVALLGLLDLLQVRGQVLVTGPGGAVDALELGILGIATPVGASDLGQLEGIADLARGGHVWAAAEIGPCALRVDLEVLARWNGVDQLDLEQLALALEEGLRLVAAPHLLGEGRVAGDDLAHLLLDLRQVVRVERLGLGKIIIEAVLDHGADGDLGAGPQLLYGFGQHVGAVVPDQLERLGIGARHEFDAGIGHDRIGKIGEGAVERHGHGALGQRLGNALGHIASGRAARVGFFCAVRKCQGDLRHAEASSHSLPTTQVRWMLL